MTDHPDAPPSQHSIHPLFICHGNLCRSQMAEAFYNHFTNTTKATSAGVDEEVPLWYDCPDQRAIRVMGELNLDISHNKVKSITPEMATAADAIIVMCDPRECPPYILNSTKTSYWTIPDPWSKPLPNYRHIRDQIKEQIIHLINTTP